MARIYNSIDCLIGNTPLLKLNNIEKEFSICANLIAKLEAFNPAGSAKDRIAKAMLDSAAAQGKLKPDTVIIEPTSGNTGIGIASVAASRGYKAIIVMPDTMSVERRKLMSAYGAELVLTDGKMGMTGAIAKAQELAKQYGSAFIPSQFDNPDNPKAHYDTTGPEIYRDTDGKIDIFVAGIGTGGTISGVGKYLKEQNPNIQIIGVEPKSSAVLSGGTAGPHSLQGIGAGFIPKTLNTQIYDEIIKVTEEQAFATAKILGKKEGFIAGISSGAALFAAIEIAKRAENKDKNIVVLLPDTGERYLSADLF